MVAATRPTNYWFIARRDTVTDEILETMTASRPCSPSGDARERADTPRLPEPGLGPADRPRRGRSPSRFEGPATRALPATRSPARCWPTGRSVLSRSFKYHRPRGAAHHGGPRRQRHGAGRRRAQRARRPPCRSRTGMAVTSINRPARSSATAYAGLELFARFLPVGFYYKTFFRPNGSLEAVREADPRAGRPRHARPEGRARPLRQGLPVLRRARWSAAARPGSRRPIAAAEAGAEVVLMDE